VHRKQIRRRRAVLALLIVGSLALLICTNFNPFLSVADRALKPARDLVNWFDETFDAKGGNERLQSELEVSRKEAVGKQAAVAENMELRKLVELDRSGAIPSSYDPVTGRVIVRRRPSGSRTW
jgi:hypothetical protein